ncbi:hypothetical protein V6N13_107007 [Hibiscus sabdariffa]
MRREKRTTREESATGRETKASMDIICFEFTRAIALERDGGDDEEERRSDSVMKVVDNGTFSKETVVSNLIMLKTVNSLEVDRMWEGNKMVDWCVIESDSGMAEENIGLVQCDEEVQCNAVDLSAECGVQNSVQQATIEETDVCSPTDHGPRCRAKIVEVIDFGGQQRKVRQLSEILMSAVPPEEKVVAAKGGILAIITQRSIAWCVGGDFNMVMRVEECRGCSNANRGIADFCEFVNTATLCDTLLQVVRNCFGFSMCGCSIRNMFGSWSVLGKDFDRNGADWLVSKMRAMKGVLKV